MAVLDPETFPQPPVDLNETGTQTALLAGGCFWCTEGVFENVPGVRDVTSGYAGGNESTADYKTVSTGRTGHAETIRITYDADQISYGQLLRIFFAVAHDPTQLNRQGNDHGSQYRSAVFYENDDQKRIAQAYIKTLDESGVYAKPIATTLEPLDRFHKAEAYHQDFMQNNPTQPYACAVGLPKVRALSAWLRAKA